MLSLHFKAASERQNREHDNRIEQAWVTARLNAYAPQHSREFTKLETLLHSNTQTQARQQTADEQIAVLKGIFGGRKR